VSEIDAILSFIPETAFRQLTIGSPLVDFNGRIHLALGLSTINDSGEKAFERDLYAVQHGDSVQYVQV
jgi:hypothetical protein